LASELSLATPARLMVRARERGRLDLTVVAFDHFGEFSLICGLLAAHGLNIESGHVHTFAPRAAGAPRARRPAARRRATPDPSLRKIVDVFQVVSRDAAAPDAALLERELQDVVRLLGTGAMEEARERINRRLAESLSVDA